MPRLKLMSCVSTRGKKGVAHRDPLDPPRRRANKQRGHGTYENDRPPIVGTVGRDRGQCRLRVRHHTDGKTLQKHGHGYTKKQTICYTDEWHGDHHSQRLHPTVCQSQKEWARDEDGDGIREVPTNTSEGLWTTARNFLRPFRGVHKKYLHTYLAICEHKINRKRISPPFISRLVTLHKSIT
jgi:transposase